jgi:carboxyl-terminal processing protease
VNQRRVFETLIALIAVALVAVAWSAPAYADGPSPTPSAPSSKLPPDLAKRVVEVTDLVLENHIDPPARQQMILAGVKALYGAASVPIPPGLSRRISTLTTSEQFPAFLADVWPRSMPKPVAAEVLEQAMLNGLLSSVPGGAHLIPEKERVVMEQSEGNRYVGIHIALGMSDQEKRPLIHEVIEGGPADRARVKNGDLIERINGVDTKGMELREAVDRLRGQEGTDVTIQVRQPKVATSRTYTITRGQHARSTVQGIRKRQSGDWDCRLDVSAPIGYLKISEISASTAHDLRKLARQLESYGPWGIILDLRSVSGTSVHPAVLLADTLLAGGVIGRVQTAQREVTYQADPDALFRNAPIAVLVDGFTAGTAEWLAAALQDNHRAIIVGAPTFSAVNITRSGATGRRIEEMRSRVLLSNGAGAIELTTSRLERGDGRPISGQSSASGTELPVSRSRPMDLDKVTTGVKPDHMVGGNANGAMGLTPSQPLPRSNQQAGSATDLTLQEAVRLLRQALQRYI